jgi:hypothetical protein
MPCRLLQALDQLLSKLSHVFVPSFRRSTFQDRHQLSNGLLFFRREVLLTRLRVDHQQIERAVATVVKVNHPRAAAFAASGPRPSDLPPSSGRLKVSSSDVIRKGLRSAVSK